MRKLVLILALSTAAFAGSTLYFANELALEREHAAALVRPAAPMAPVRTASLPAPIAPAPPAKPVVVGEKATAFISGAMINGQPMSEADMRRMQSEYSRNFLAQLADPEQRADVLAQHRMVMRMSFPRVDQVVGLSAEEYSRFLELNALQQVDMQEASSRCMLDPRCDMSELYRNGMETRRQDIADLLGPERAQKFETYKNTMGEREAITQLRTRLPDSQRLSDDKAEQLITALASERDSLTREAMQSGNGMSSFGMGVGMVFAPNDGRSIEERYEIARQNSQRLRDRAAQYLSSEQLRLFNEMQDETLLGMRSALRNKDGINYSAVSIAVPGG